MVGIAIELLLSFLLLKYLFRRNLGILGLRPTGIRMYQLMLGLLVPIVFFCVLKFGIAYLMQNPYRINQAYTFRDFVNTMGYLLRSVAYEELLFRGVLLWMFIWKFGVTKGVMGSAIAFGMYHWFAWGAFGNPIQMAIVFFTTGSMGYVFALAYAKTGSMYLGYGLHLGNNIASMLIFSTDQSIGAQWLVKTFEKDQAVPAMAILILVAILHYIGLQILCYFVVKKVGRRVKTNTLSELFLRPSQK